MRAAPPAALVTVGVCEFPAAPSLLETSAAVFLQQFDTRAPAGSRHVGQRYLVVPRGRLNREEGVAATARPPTAP